MIVVRLLGGLGNQLFQVAAGRYVAHRYGRSVRFDTSWFEENGNGPDTKRQLEVSGPMITGDEMRLPGALARAVYRPRNPLLLRETSPEQDLLNNLPGGPRFLHGYFQRTAYALSASDDLRPRLTPILDRIAPQVNTDGAIGVHLRLGDYYTDPTTRAHHGVSSPAYYTDAIAELYSHRTYARVVVFTDSPELAEKHFMPVLPPSAVVVHDRSAWETLVDFASCDALVLSNSSLSWWGAFIGTIVRHRTISVIRPVPWFAVPSLTDRLLAVPHWSDRDRLVQRPPDAHRICGLQQDAGAS